MSERCETDKTPQAKANATDKFNSIARHNQRHCLFDNAATTNQAIFSAIFNSLLEGKVSSDEGLNDRHPGDSQEVSHLDFCLSPLELPPNTALLGACLEGDGCFPAGPAQGVAFPNVEYGSELENETVVQRLVPAQFSAQSNVCGGNIVAPGVREFPFVAEDPRVNGSGNVILPSYSLPLSDLFNIAGFFTEFYPDDSVPEVLLHPTAIGSPCLALIYGRNSIEFEGLAQAGVLVNGGVITVTQFPELVDGMAILPAIAPLKYCDLGSANCEPLPPDGTCERSASSIRRSSYHQTRRCSP